MTLLRVGVALLEEESHWGWALGFQELKPDLVAHCLFLLLGNDNASCACMVKSQLIHDTSSEHTRQECPPWETLSRWGTLEVSAKKPKNQEPFGKVRLNLWRPVVAQVSECLRWQAGHDLKGLFPGEAMFRTCPESHAESTYISHIGKAGGWDVKRQGWWLS